jgi:hypothetical protein
MAVPPDDMPVPALPDPVAPPPAPLAGPLPVVVPPAPDAPDAPDAPPLLVVPFVSPPPPPPQCVNNIALSRINTLSR